MKKFVDWMEKPMTYGGYAKLCGIAMAISAVVTGIYLLVYFADEVQRFFGKIENKFKSIFRRNKIV